MPRHMEDFLIIFIGHSHSMEGSNHCGHCKVGDYEVLSRVLEGAPRVEVPLGQMYEVVTGKVVKDGSELCGTAVEIGGEGHACNGRGMYCLWLQVNGAMHAFGYRWGEIGWYVDPLTSQMVFIPVSPGLVYLRHRALSVPPLLPECPIVRRPYMAAKKAVLFLLGKVLPDDVAKMAVRMYLDCI